MPPPETTGADAHCSGYCSPLPLGVGAQERRVWHAAVSDTDRSFMCAQGESAFPGQARAAWLIEARSKSGGFLKSSSQRLIRALSKTGLILAIGLSKKALILITPIAQAGTGRFKNHPDFDNPVAKTGEVQIQGPKSGRCVQPI